MSTSQSEVSWRNKQPIRGQVISPPANQKAWPYLVIFGGLIAVSRPWELRHFLLRLSMLADDIEGDNGKDDAGDTSAQHECEHDVPRAIFVQNAGHANPSLQG